MFGVTSHKAANSTSGMDVKILKPSGFFRYHQVYNMQKFYMVLALS
jgi:hypothetical protein